MSDQLPVVSIPEVQGPLAKPSRGSLSSEMEFSTAGMAIRTLEQGMQLAQYLVSGKAAPKDWTAAQVFLAMQAGLEHGLGYTGGIQSFVIINNMPSWRGQAAVGKIRASKVLKPGTLDFGCEEDVSKVLPDGTHPLRGWCRGQRIGDPAPKVVYFTQQEAIEAGLWSAGNNWTKFKRRMLMWRAVGFLTKDLFGDVLGNFPIAEELYSTPEHWESGDSPKAISGARVSLLEGAVDGESLDPVLDGLIQAPEAPGSLQETTAAPEAQSIDPAPPKPAQARDGKAEGRFRDALAHMDEAETLGDLEKDLSRARKLAGEDSGWVQEAKAKFEALRTTRFGNVRE